MPRLNSLEPSTIPLGIGEWQSVSENVRRLRLRNMYIAENPGSPDHLMRIGRPTLEAFATAGSGPVYGMWRQDGTLNGDWLVVSGDELYRVTTDGVASLIDTLVGVGFCQFAGTADRALVVRDGTCYAFDGTDLTTIVMPDDVLVGSVACINQYFLLSVKDSDRVYYIDPGETDPDALNFFTAERSPDPIVSINIVSDEVWLMGSSGPEVWTASGDADAPFQRTAGRVYSDGCAARDTALVSTKDGYPCLLWVTDTRGVNLARGTPAKVSTESVDEILKTATNLRAWTFRLNRHDFYVLTADETTLVYDIMQDHWSIWDSYGYANWRAHLGGFSGSTAYAGDSVDGTIWQLTTGVSDDGEFVIHEISGDIDVPGTSQPCASVLIRLNAGWSPSYDYEPMLELRWSDDQGATFSNYVSISMGNRGEYSKDIVFRSMGLMERPSRTLEFRFSGYARLRIDYALLNAA